MHYLLNEISVVFEKFRRRLSFIFFEFESPNLTEFGKKLKVVISRILSWIIDIQLLQGEIHRDVGMIHSIGIEDRNIGPYVNCMRVVRGSRLTVL